MCARPISSSRALLRVRTCEPTHRKRLAAGVLAILWAIDRYMYNFSSNIHSRSFSRLVSAIMPACEGKYALMYA